MGVVANLLTQFANRGRLKTQRAIDSKGADVAETEEVSRLLAVLEDSRRTKNQQTQPWVPSFEYYMGKQLDWMPDWKADIVANEIHAAVEVTLSLINQQRPVPEFMAKSDEFDEYTDRMDQWWEDEAERLELDEITQDVDKTGLIFGVGIYRPGWCTFEKEITVRDVHPVCFFLDPKARNIRTARWCAEERQMSVSEILKEFPQAEGKVSPGSQMLNIDHRYIEETTSSFGGEIPGFPYSFRVDSEGQATDMVVEYSRIDPAGVPTSEDLVQVIEFWIRDPRVVQVHMMNMENGDRMVHQRMLYPNGRHVVIASGRKLLDEANPYAHGEFPYVEQHCYRVPGRFWSKSLVGDLLSPQDEINKTLGHLIDNRNLMGNNQFTYTTSSGIDPDNITSEPGLGIPVQQQGDFQRVPAPPLPSYISELLMHLQGIRERISNVPAVAQGVHNSQMSGVAIEQLLNSVNVAVGFMITNKERAMKRLARQCLALAQQYEESARTVTMVDPATGRTISRELTPQQIQHGWGVRIVSGSSIPMNKESTTKWAIEMLKMQLIGPKTALEAMRMPLARKALREMREQQAMQHRMQLQIAMAQAMAGGGASGPGGPPPPGSGAPSPVDASGQPVQSGPRGEGVYQ